MRISIIPIAPPDGIVLGSQTAAELTGTTADTFVSGLKGPTEWDLQINKLIDSQSADFQDRGNVVDELTFTVHRTWPDAQTAALFALKHASQVPHVGTIIFTVLTVTGATAGTASMAKGAIKVTREKWSGVSTVFSYKIIGQQIS